MKKVLNGVLASIGAVALLLTMSALLPNRAHALAAALVEVVNTTASPAITQDVSKMASQLVELGAVVTSGTTNQPLVFIDPSGGNNGPYTVPAGQKLVISGIDVLTTMSTGFSGLQLVQNGAIDRDYWQISNSTPTTQLLFPAGIVIPGGQSLGVANYTFGGTNPQTMIVTVRGYLTSN